MSKNDDNVISVDFRKKESLPPVEIEEGILDKFSLQEAITWLTIDMFLLQKRLKNYSANNPGNVTPK